MEEMEVGWFDQDGDWKMTPVVASVVVTVATVAIPLAAGTVEIIEGNQVVDLRVKDLWVTRCDLG